MGNHEILNHCDNAATWRSFTENERLATLYLINEAILRKEGAFQMLEWWRILREPEETQQMIHNVLIFSNQNAYRAQEAINDAIEKYQDEETDVNYELMIETSAMIGANSETRYTVLIEVSDKDSA